MREVLDCFTPDTPQLRVVDIQAMTSFPATTVARLVQSLQAEALLERQGDYYRISTHVLTWAAAATSGSSLLAEASIVARELCKETAETTGAYVRAGASRLTIALEIPNREIVHRGSVGQLHPLTMGAPGWVIMAHDPAGRLLALEDSAPTQVVKRQSMTNFDAELETIRKTGISVTGEERQRGLTSIAAPIFFGGGNFAGAIGIAGPTWRLTRDEIAELTPLVRSAARGLSERLGYFGQSAGSGVVGHSADKSSPAASSSGDRNPKARA
jgi:DNA-binding IclR family transcriptional regulator